MISGYNHNPLNPTVKNNVEVLFCPLLSDVRDITALFEDSQASPSCSSDKSGAKMKRVAEHL
jgi:hypothetical protein